MSRYLALLLSVVTISAAAFGSAHFLEGSRPVVMTPSDSNPVPGETFLVTVTLSQPASQSGELSISSTTLGNISSFPTSVPINAGDTSETFSVTVSSLASGSVQLSAFTGGGGASMQVAVADVSEQTSEESGLLSAIRF